MDERRPVPAWIAPAVVSLAALALYMSTACRWVLGGDVGEFATLAAEGGVAHPPGYPLFTVVLRALFWLPGATPMQKAARATGVCAALGVLAVYAGARSWRASVLASSIAAVAFAMSSTQWLLATEPEVFALNAAIAAAIVAAAGPDARVKGVRRAVVLGLLFGLGLAHQHTILATVPVLGAGLYRALKDEKAGGRGAALSAVAFLAALSPYAYTVFTSHHADGRWVWGDPMGAVDLLRHVARADYWHAADGRGGAFTNEQWAALAERLGGDLTWPLLALAVFGGSHTLAREHDLRAGFSILAAAILAGPVFLWMVTRSGGMGSSITTPTGVNRLIIERFYLLPEVLLTVPLAWGADRVLTRIPARLYRPPVALAACAAVIAAGFPPGLARLRDLEGATVEHYLVDSLTTAPEDAVIIGTGDHRFFGFLYEQHARGLRPDVLYLDASLRFAPWYQRRVEAALGPVDASSPAHPPPPSIADDIVGRALASGRPVLVADDFDPEGLARRPHYAIGTLICVLPDDATVPEPEDVEAMNIALFGRFTRDPVKPRDPWGWAGEADEMYARPWLALAAAFDKRGDMRRAHDEIERATRRAP